MPRPDDEMKIKYKLQQIRDAENELNNIHLSPDLVDFRDRAMELNKTITELTQQIHDLDPNGTISGGRIKKSKAKKSKAKKSKKN